MDNGSRKKKKHKGTRKKAFIVVLILILLAAAAAFMFLPRSKPQAASEITYIEGKVAKQTIRNTLTASGTLKPADSYSVTAGVGGEILECNFEEGDTVNKDDIMYVIDSSDMENTIDRAQISYERTERSYKQTLESLDELEISSDIGGIVTKVYVSEGDEIRAGAEIADIRDYSVMHLTLPFAASDAENVKVGDSGYAVLDGSYEKIVCRVEEIDRFVSDYNGRSVRYIKVSIDNADGVLLNTVSATLELGDSVSLSGGKLEYNEEKTITSKTAGTVVVIVSKGETVSEGTLLCRLESEELQNSYKDAKASLDDAALSFENTREKLDDYSIKAPITGTVIEKYSKAGDTLDATKGQTTLALIYDLSYLTFDISLDELDISLVKTGQKVVISCDAISAENIEGVITKVSVVGTTTYNSTSYPVTIRIDNPPDGMLAGMNVDASIIVEEAENVLSVPSAAIQRGDVVYVADDGSKSADDNAPEGYRSVKVTTGIANDDYIELTDPGELSEGDTVYAPQAVRLKSDDDMFMNFGGGDFQGGGNYPSGGGDFSSGRPSGGPSGGMPGGGMR